MRVLNADVSPKKRLAPAEPETFCFRVRDRTFVLDSNSLLLTLVENESEEKAIVSLGVRSKPVFPYYPMVGSRYLVMNVCHSCNMQCKYCSVQAYYPDSDMMTLETAKQAIHYFFPNEPALKTASIGFFGGEPLLNWSLIESVTKYFEGLCTPRKPHFHITTNGTLLTKERAEFLAKRNYSLIISLDGPKEVHDTLRVKRDGSGSFDETMEGLKNAHEAGLSKHITLRSTYTPETADTLLERAKFLNDLCYRGLATHVSIEPAFLTESLCVEAAKAKQGVTEKDVEALEPEYMKVADWFVDEVKAGRRPVFHNLTKSIERILWTIPYATECGAAKGYFTVNAKGELFGCHREQSSGVGNLHKGGIDESLRAKWLDNRIYLRKGCMSCPIRFLCGGGCREESIGEHGDIRIPVKVGCALKMVFLRAAVWIMSELQSEQLCRVVPKPLALRKLEARRKLT